MSDVWNRTLVYLGLREEPEETYEELPERFEEADDARTQRTSERSRRSSSPMGPSDASRAAIDTSRPATDESSFTIRDRASSESSNVRALRAEEPYVRAVHGLPARATRVAHVDVASFEDVEGVGSRFRIGQAVLFDITSEDQVVARRVVDFVSGLTYASRGRLTKVGSRAFLLVPDGVQLAEDEQRRLTGLGYRLPIAVDA